MFTGKREKYIDQIIEKVMKINRLGVYGADLSVRGHEGEIHISIHNEKENWLRSIRVAHNDTGDLKRLARELENGYVTHHITYTEYDNFTHLIVSRAIYMVKNKDHIVSCLFSGGTDSLGLFIKETEEQGRQEQPFMIDDTLNTDRDSKRLENAWVFMYTLLRNNVRNYAVVEEVASSPNTFTIKEG